jgi:hypothetical protein
MDVASKDDKKESVLVTLDTGTKPDWISQRFLTEVLCMNHNKLTDDDKQEFLDFNGNTFNPIGKVEVMVHSTDFIGFPTRQLTFLVAKKGAFQILLGNRTIKKEKLLCKPPDSRGETAFPAVQTEPKKSVDYRRAL